MSTPVPVKVDELDPAAWPPPGPWDDWKARRLTCPPSAHPSVVAELVERHAPGHDGLIPQSLDYVLWHCMRAHLDRAAAGDAAERAHAGVGLTLEIGAYRGQTTLALLDLLRCLYPYDQQPLVVSADPYGGKPYNGGNTVPLHSDQLYGDPVYLDAKKRLACSPSHAHFMLTGEDFLKRCMGARYWLGGVPRTMDWITFAFVDGDHDAATVAAECMLLIPRMRKGARLVVDNVDMDTRTVRELQAILPGVEIGPPAPKGALQASWVAP